MSCGATVSHCVICELLPAQTYVVGRLGNVAEGRRGQDRGDLLCNVDVGHDGCVVVRGGVDVVWV